jgi:hypothetical protein
LLKLREDVAGAKSPDALERLQRDAAATDRAIDQLVYDLYGLDPGEISLVEDLSVRTTPVKRGEELDPGQLEEED